MDNYIVSGKIYPQREFYTILEDNYMYALANHSVWSDLNTLKIQLEHGIPVVIGDHLFKIEKGEQE